MAKIEKLKEATEEVNDDADVSEQPKHKIEILENGTIINGHHLKEGHVVQLTAEEIDRHRDRGLRFGPVAEDDEREILDISEPV